MTAGDPQPAQENLYAPPQAEIAPITESAPATPFYVVSVTKVVLLSLATLGFYSLYWFWRHWTLHKRDKKLDIWPLARAIFAIFFAHSLNEEIDHRLVRNGTRYAWSPRIWATVYVLSAIAERIVSRIPESVMSLNTSTTLSVLLMVGVIVPLVQAQRAANLACGDPEANANRQFTPANWIWLVLGGVLWLFILLGLALPDESA